jgi:MFS family permease
MDDDLLRRTTDAAGAAKDDGGAGRGKAYFEWALASFYIAYIAFEWMSLLWSCVPAHAYVASLVLSWGVVASLQAVATSYPVLIALRFLLGVGEAGFTGIPIYLSFFFRREELALRTAIFISGKA